MKNSKEKTKAQLESNLSKLPDTCIIIDEFGDYKPNLVFVEKGIKGYKPLKKESSLNNPCLRAGETLAEFADRFNSRFNVTSQQRYAMTFGSMFGFDKIEADPDRYNEDGSQVLDVFEEAKAEAEIS